MPEPWQPPPEFEEYRLLRLLGRGGMGVVWLAWDRTLERNVAIKFLALARPSPVIRERFLIEARAVARLHHPNVIDIHRVGEVDDHPYLVAEYLHGKSLDELPLPLELGLGLDIALGLARGLAAAHRRGVLHRDVKPANGFLTDEGMVKLLDFGVAKLVDVAGPEGRGTPQVGSLAEAETQELDVTPSPSGERNFPTEAGAIIGTPAYIAPELWRGDAPSPQGDVYALGVTLYKLYTGVMPYGRRATVHEMIAAAASDDPPPVQSARDDLPHAIAEVIDRCLQRDPGARFHSAEAVRDVLERIRRGPSTGELPVGNPYRGLQPFQPEHRQFFFGRDLEVGEVIDRLRAEPCVVVAGRSGIGKSSFVRAGLLPAIEEGALRSGTWRTVTMVPGRAPRRALVHAMARELGVEEAVLEEAPEALGRRLRRRDLGTVLFVDQLEELVTMSEPDERDGFVEILRHLFLFSPVVRVLATVRSDHLAQFDTLETLRAELVRGLHLLGPLRAEGVHAAITAPALAHGVRFEDPEDVVQLAAAGGEGSLPLLEFALARLWELRDDARKVIPARALAGIGGVEGALARHADDVLDLMTPAARAAARKLLSALVTAGRTRMRRREEELATGPLERQALEALVRGRLLVATDEGYEITHEALVTGWPRLRGWLEEEDDARKEMERLSAAAREWDRLARPPDALWRGRQLGGATLVDKLPLRPAERDFLDASLRSERRARLRRLAFAAGVPLLLLAGVLGAQAISRARAGSAAAREVRDATLLLGRARAQAAILESRRLASLALFDVVDLAGGNRLREEAAALGPVVDEHLDAVLGPINRALGQVAGHEGARRVAADLYALRFGLAERQAPAQLGSIREQLAFFDDKRRYSTLFSKQGRLRVTTTPPGVSVSLVRHVARDGRLVAEMQGTLGATPIDVGLDVGSYLLVFEKEGYAPARAPVLIRRGALRIQEVALLRPEQIPEGFAYVPGGAFIYGSDDPDLVPLGTVDPAHETTLGPFLIARQETTFGDYLRYLATLSGEARDQARGKWLTQALVFSYAQWPPLVPGATFKLPYRKPAEEVSWLRLPAFGYAYDDAARYAAWLAATGAVPGARVCTEREWEKAARGADGRRFPHGDRLAPRDASFAETDGLENQLDRLPDEVGHWPPSRSVYGVDDLVGNVWEWVSGAAGKPTMRSGAFFTVRSYVRAATKTSVGSGSNWRVDGGGIRVCASSPIPTVRENPTP